MQHASPFISIWALNAYVPVKNVLVCNLSKLSKSADPLFPERLWSFDVATQRAETASLVHSITGPNTHKSQVPTFLCSCQAVAYSSSSASSSSRETTKKVGMVVVGWQTLASTILYQPIWFYDPLLWLTVNFIPLVASRVYFFAWLTFDKKSGF